jgi:predicted aspartyl protease
MPAYNDVEFDPPAPTAVVALRAEGQRRVLSDVPMLIDSGADMTFLPASAVNQLGLVRRGDYEVTAFDGSMSVVEAVRCELVFLGRVYGGIYLIINEPCGLLGRDVLNDVSLLLDGPRLSWHEATGESEE